MFMLKKIPSCFMGLVMAIFGLFGSAEAVQNNQNKKVLIAYFSHTGNTDLVAKEIKNKLNGCDVDVARIVPTNSYPDYGDELRDLARKEADDDGCRPEFEVLSTGEKKIEAQNYDEIFIGSPVWWYKAPKIVVSFIEKQDFSGRKVHFFITHGGGPGSCYEDMKSACKGANFDDDPLEIYGNYPGNGEIDREKVDKWVDKVS